MAVTRQLFVYGPTYLEPNAETLVASYAPLIGDFDLRSEDWGFIAGTCFWIRTSILQDMAACAVEFLPAEYVSDGAPAHAAERMFGLAVALRVGTVLLQDLRFADRQTALYVARPIYRATIQHHIDMRQKKFKAELAKNVADE